MSDAGGGAGSRELSCLEKVLILRGGLSGTTRLPALVVFDEVQGFSRRSPEQSRERVDLA